MRDAFVLGMVAGMFTVCALLAVISGTSTTIRERSEVDAHEFLTTLYPRAQFAVICQDEERARGARCECRVDDRPVTLVCSKHGCGFLDGVRPW